MARTTDVEAIVEKLRNDKPVEADDLAALYAFRNEANLKEAIQRDDERWILALAQSKDIPRRQAGWRLMSGIRESIKVQEAIATAWDDNPDVDSRLLLMWRVLDDPKVDQKRRAEVWRVVREEFDSFARAFLIGCCGRPAWGALTAGERSFFRLSIEQRVSDPATPEKKWFLYYCAAAIAADDDWLRRLEGLRAVPKDELTPEVLSEVRWLVTPGRWKEVAGMSPQRESIQKALKRQTICVSVVLSLDVLAAAVLAIFSNWGRLPVVLTLAWPAAAVLVTVALCAVLHSAAVVRALGAQDD